MCIIIIQHLQQPILHNYLHFKSRILQSIHLYLTTYSLEDHSNILKVLKLTEYGRGRARGR